MRKQNYDLKLYIVMYVYKKGDFRENRCDLCRNGGT